MQLLYELLGLLTSTALLIPIGALGAWRWLMWLAKRVPALFYRPIQNDFDCTATIVTPFFASLSRSSPMVPTRSSGATNFSSMVFQH